MYARCVLGVRTVARSIVWIHDGFYHTTHTHTVFYVHSCFWIWDRKCSNHPFLALVNVNNCFERGVSNNRNKILPFETKRFLLPQDTHHINVSKSYKFYIFSWKKNFKIDSPKWKSLFHGNFAIRMDECAILYIRLVWKWNTMSNGRFVINTTQDRSRFGVLGREMLFVQFSLFCNTL